MNTNLSTPTSINYQYLPVGSSEKLQRDLANYVAKLLAMNGGTTLEEVGYLGSTVLTDRAGSRLVVQLMFHPKLVAKKVENHHTSEPELILDGAMENLSNHMFVGEASNPNVVSLELCHVPNHYIEKRGDGKRMLRLKFDNNGKIPNESVKADCVVITCNPSLVFAALVDTSLNDPNYEVRIVPVKKPAKISKPDSACSLVPAFVTITKSSEGDYHYVGNDAVPYLQSLMRQAQTKNQAMRQKSRKVMEDAEENPKKVKKAKNKVKGGNRKFRAL